MFAAFFNGLLGGTPGAPQHTTWNKYDALNRLIRTVERPGTGPDDSHYATVTTYDAVGNVQSVTDPAGNTTSYDYDRINRQVKETDALWNSSSFQYDLASDLTQKTDRNGLVTRYIYDSLGRRVEEDWMAGESVTHATKTFYDAAGEVYGVQDPAATDYYQYDQDGRVTRSRTAPGDLPQTTSINWNPVNDSLPNTISTDSWTIGALDLGTTLGATVTSTGSPQFHPYLKFVSPSGRIVAVADSGNTYSATLQIPLSERAVAPDSWRVVVTGSPNYPASNGPFAYTLTLSGTAFTSLVDLAYTYYADGTMHTLTDSSTVANVTGHSGTLTYTYDAIQRLTDVKDQAGNGISAKHVEFVYNDASQPTTIARYNAADETNLVATTRYTKPDGSTGYDGMGRLTAMNDKDHNNNPVAIVAYAWTFDAASRITEMGIDHTNGSYDSTNDYTLDKSDQLLTATLGIENYSYDGNGNRTNSGATVWTTGPANRLLSDGTYTYCYDAEGNRTERFVWTDSNHDGFAQDSEKTQYVKYTWDRRNRLTQVDFKNCAADSTTTKSLAYTYDASDRRIRRGLDDDGTFGQGAMSYRYNVYQGDDPLLEITDTDGLGSGSNPTISHRYLYGAAVDQILATDDLAGNVRWGLADHEGSIRDVVQLQGATTALLDHRGYNSFGVMSQSNPAIDFIFGYAGRPWDNDAQLSDYRARWYDPLVGRFVSEDPSGLAPDMNQYRYVGNNPVARTDPSGLDPWSGTGVGSLGGLGSDNSILSPFLEAEIQSHLGLTPSDLFTPPPPQPVYHYEKGVDINGREYEMALDANGKIAYVQDSFRHSGYLVNTKYDGYYKFVEEGVQHLDLSEPSSMEIWLGLFGMVGGGPAVGALSRWSPAVRTTLQVGGVATTGASVYTAEEYGRAAYYSHQAGDPEGVLVNSGKALLSGGEAALGAYTSLKAYRSGSLTVVDSEGTIVGTAEIAAPGEAGSTFNGRFARVDPNEIGFSQRTAGGSGRAAPLRESMAGGWNGPAIDAVQTPNGLVTIDNTRVAIAQALGIPEIPVKVRLPSDPLPPSMLGRFGSAKTWGEALIQRTGNQRPPLPPEGTMTRPRLPP